MRRDEVVEVLKGSEPAIRALGAASLYLYGSYARDEARAGSDVDLFIDRDPDKKLGLLELVEMKELLEKELACEVDVGARAGLQPALKANIETTAIKVF